MTGGPLQCFINHSSINVYVESWVLLQGGCQKQMRFQFSFEGLSVCSSFNFYWQLISDAWCSDREGMFAKLKTCPPGNKVIVAIRAVQSSARYRCCRFNQVLEVRRWTSIDGLKDKQTELEFNPLLNLQSMERSECWCYVISWWKVAHKRAAAFITTKTIYFTSNCEHLLMKYTANIFIK